MNVPLFVLAVIIGLMLAELRVSRAHERRLMAEGAIRPPGDVYLAIGILYPAAFVAMGLEGAWRAGSATVSPSLGPSWFVSGVLLFAASKFLKYWAIRSLGYRWSFRVWVIPGRTLVTSGPYRYVAHPNYIALVGELVSTAMMMGARIAGPISVCAFGLALWARLRFEERVLAAAGALGPAGVDSAASEG